MNYRISIDLKKLTGVGVLKIKGKTATKRCVVIPIEDNPEMFESEKGGVYLNLNAVEYEEPKFEQTHFIKGSLPKEMLEAMSQEERRARPFLGNMKELGKLPAPPKPDVPTAEVVTEANPETGEVEDDLPF